MFCPLWRHAGGIPDRWAGGGLRAVRRPPTRAQLDRFFFLNDADRRRVAQRRLPHTQLGFAVQVGTVRFLGTFLADPLACPARWSSTLPANWASIRRASRRTPNAP